VGHCWAIFGENVGKYSSTMEHLGNRLGMCGASAANHGSNLRESLISLQQFDEFGQIHSKGKCYPLVI